MYDNESIKSAWNGNAVTHQLKRNMSGSPREITFDSKPESERIIQKWSTVFTPLDANVPSNKKKVLKYSGWITAKLMCLSSDVGNVNNYIICDLIGTVTLMSPCNNLDLNISWKQPDLNIINMCMAFLSVLQASRHCTGDKSRCNITPTWLTGYFHWIHNRGQRNIWQT